MPCWLKQTTPVDLGPNTSIELLTTALRGLGFHINDQNYSAQRGYKFSADCFTRNDFRRMSVVVTNDNKIEIGYASTDARVLPDKLNAIKRAYSTEVVKSTANRFGWRLQQKEQNQLVAMRRF